MPQETFFGLQDFLVFAEMEWSCKELPPDDVEACIRYVKAKAPGLDPANPTDREKIALEISRFFADPGRKYKQEMERLEAEKKNLANDYENRLSQAEGVIRQQITLIDEMKAGQLRKEQDELERRNIRSTYKRAAAIAFLWLLFEAGVVYLAHLYGDGDNILQRVANFWPYLVLIFGVFTLLFIWLLGIERLRLLGEPIRHLFGLEK